MADFSVPEIKAKSKRTIELAKGVNITIDVGDFASALTDNLGSNVDRLLGKGGGDLSFDDIKLVSVAVGQVLTPLIKVAKHDPKVVLAELSILVLFSLIKYIFTEFKDFDIKKKLPDSNDSTESPPVSGSN